MIVVKLMGGLGNQMFQYATGVRLAERHKTTLKLDLSSYRIAHSGTPRVYELSSLAVRAPAASATELARASRGRGVASVIRRLVQTPFSIIQERGVAFDPSVLEAPDFSYLDGYWQSEKYFREVREVLLGELAVRTPMEGLNRTLAGEISETLSVSIHVRRTDYVTDQATHQTHGVCGPEYFQAALAAIVDRVVAPRFFVFSDDLDWARTHLSFAQPATFVGHNGTGRGFEDMRLMSLCKHNIIANSSFSWWGAWLNRNPGKIVVAPDRWYARPELDTRDVIPGEWIRL